MYKIKIFFVALGCILGHLVSVGSDLQIEVHCDNLQLRNQIVVTALAEQGFQETSGANDGPRIREYWKAVKGISYPVPWCAIFVKWVYTTYHIETPGNAYVPSWSNKRQYVIYTRGAKDNHQYPCAGDAVTFYYPAMHREAHIGLVAEWPPGGDYFYTVEGNTTNVSGSREGNSVRRKMRRKTDAYKIMRFI
jgi:hypothetical protein